MIIYRSQPIILLFLSLFIFNMLSMACAPKEKAVDVKQLVESRCSTCHFSTNIYAVKKSPEQWASTVERMRLINPELISSEDGELIVDYLKTMAN